MLQKTGKRQHSQLKMVSKDNIFQLERDIFNLSSTAERLSLMVSRREEEKTSRELIKAFTV